MSACQVKMAVWGFTTLSGGLSPKRDLNHQDLLYELELFCEVSGTRFLHVDIAETRRWEDHATSQVPYLTDCGIGFTTNCEDLCKSFEDWSTDHVFDNVLSWDFSTWLAEWSVDTLR